MTIYKANRKGYIKYILFVFMILPFFLFLLNESDFADKPFLVLVVFIPAILFLWIYVDTYYKIDGNKLIYHSAFIHGRIDIDQIKQITKGKTLWVGVKPALSTKGLIIKYNKYDEIYIAPESNEDLISDLLKLNKEIAIIE